MENLWLPKETGLFGGGDGLGVWEGNVVKLGCDDGYTTINITQFMELVYIYKIYIYTNSMVLSLPV